MNASLRALPLLSIALAFAAPISGQRELTVEMIFDSRELLPAGSGARWMPDGSRLSHVTADGLVVEDPVSGAREVVIRSAELVPQGGSVPVPIEGYAWSPDGGAVLIYTNSQRVWRQNTKGVYYVFDLGRRTLTPLSRTPGWQQFAKWSPNGDQIGFVRDNDIFVVDLPSYEERALTADGSDVVINGTFDWVYEEELGLQDGWRWSPDGERIAYWQIDQSEVPVFTWIDDLGDRYSQPVELRYPKAGEPGPRARIGIVDADGGSTTWMRTGGAPDDYLARMDWAGNSDEVVVQRLNRLQNRIDLVIANARSGNSRVIFSDTDPAWVDVDDDFHWLSGGDRFLWTSERDGYNQIFLHGRDGRVIRKLADVPVDVVSIAGVDEAHGWVYYIAAPEAPKRQAFRVRLNGGAPERLTETGGSHSISLSADGRYLIDRYSSAGVPPVVRITTASGEPVRVLVDNNDLRQRLASMALRAPEFLQVPGADGSSLNGYVIRPPDFDASREYPVLFYVYGTPGAQTVTDSWGGTRYLWHQLLAQRGYVVASVDTRGTGNRGREFEKAGYLRQGEVVTDDLLAAARWFGAQPWVDAGRIGMWGWSGGGYTTGLALARGGDLFAAGISVAPVTDWRLYDNIYTERFMRTPDENAAGYAATSVVELADGITADYLLIHGTSDDNVHFQNAVQLVSALQSAGVQFDFMLYPNQNHAIPEFQVHLFSLMTNWIMDHL